MSYQAFSDFSRFSVSTRADADLETTNKIRQLVEKDSKGDFRSDTLLAAKPANPANAAEALSPPAHRPCGSCQNLTRESIGMCRACETREVRFHRLGVHVVRHMGAMRRRSNAQPTVVRASAMNERLNSTSENDGDSR